MKKKTALMTSVVALGALLLTACPAPQAEDYVVTGDYLAGKKAKKVYNAYMGEAPKDLNAIKSQDGGLISHIANFEDCLVMNDGYGILRKSLASRAERNSTDTEFKFTVKSNIPWIKYDGTQYEDEDGEKQYVSADDFVNTAKLILDYNNDSQIYYMYTLFVKNAWEFYCWTMMSKYMAEGKIIDGVNYEVVAQDPNLQAQALTNLVKKYSNKDPDTAITANDLKAIDRFERVGVKAEGDVVTYTLNQSAPFFPTMLTYTPFVPINRAFYKEQGVNYGKKKENILYCGPFLCKEFTTETMKYEKNPYYWNKDYVHIDQINYTAASASIGYKEQREAFETGRVDGFSLNAKDKIGWDTYIKGGDDGQGTIQQPASNLVNSRELDDIDYTYHFVLNPNRSTEEDSYSNSAFYNKYGKNKAADDIANTNKALSLREVRKLILEGIDLESYNVYYNAPERDQYQMNTFTPRGYVIDAANKNTDYIDYYYAYFAEQKGLVDPEDPEVTFDDEVAAGKEAVGPQQITGVNLTKDEAILAKYPWLNVDTTVNRAQQAVELYNDEANAGEEIKLPVNIEFLGVGGLDPDSKTKEENLVTLWNVRSNGCAINQADAELFHVNLCDPNPETGKVEDYPYFHMQLSNASTSEVLTKQANNGYYTIYTGWGWMGDYADPLTYVHCYVTHGEMAKMSGNNNRDYMSYRLSEDGTELSGEKMYEAYNTAVDAANEERASITTRYQMFAECEYQLLNDLYVIRPSAMYTQGWVASVSRAAGYDNPQAHYGLADHILAGMWVLVDVPDRDERQACRDKHDKRAEEELAAVGGNAINGAFIND